MFFINKNILLIIGLMCCVAAIDGQNVKQLEAQRKKALEQIETTSKMLNETKKTQQSSVNKIVLINRNIQERQTLISSINQEVEVLDEQMNQLNTEKEELQNQLKLIKNDYAKMLQQSQSQQSFQNKLMFVFSAKTFSQTIRRLRYLKEYSDYRKQQAIKIQNIAQGIEIKNDSLNIYKNRQLNVVRQKTAETDKLTVDKKKENQIVSELSKKQKELESEIDKQKKKANELNAKIENLIAQEIARADAKRKAEEERKARQEKTKSQTDNSKPVNKPAKSNSDSGIDKNTATTSISKLTAEESLLAGGFEINQGRLPFPTNKGFISGHFGVQKHPVLSHVTTDNKGIYIQTPNGTNARAVFDGVVTQLFSIPGSNNAIIIQHGNYRTVYANLTDIYVKVGEKVKAKQNIGKIFTDDENDNKTELYFQIWRDKAILNPENWLTK